MVKSLPWHGGLLYPIFKRLRRQTRSSDLFKPFLATEDIKLRTDTKESVAVIHFDEARGLLSQGLKEEPMRHLALRSALMNWWHSTEKIGFYARLLNTSSRVIELSSPLYIVQGQKYPQGNSMLPPLFEVATMDMSVDDRQPYNPTDTLSTDISNGIPLLNTSHLEILSSLSLFLICAKQNLRKLRKTSCRDCAMKMQS